MIMIDLGDIPANFLSASRQVTRYLQRQFGFQLWMVARIEGDDWIVLHAEDRGYNIKSDTVFRWDDAFCSCMIRGCGPCIAPDSRKAPAYMEAPIGQRVSIGAYIGMPIYRNNGELFGTLCAIDPEPQPDNIIEGGETIKLLTCLLNALLNRELDLQQESRRAERAEFESERDALTPLFNRRGWDKLVGIEESRCHRYGNIAAIISIDLDNLKHTNDSAGHDAGDRLLIETGRSLSDIARPSDVIARVGGDEFLMLAIDCDENGAEHLMERIVSVFSERGIYASLGYGVRHPDGDLVATWKEADRKMYQAKRYQRQLATVTRKFG